MHMHAKYQVFICTCSKLWPMLKLPANKYLTYDLEGWPWPWNITLNMLGFIRCTCMLIIKSLICTGSKVKVNGRVSDFTSIFDLWPWRMPLILTCHQSKCATSWDTHECQICLWLLVQKSWPMLKLFTNKHTDRQDKNNI